MEGTADEGFAALTLALLKEITETTAKMEARAIFLIMAWSFVGELR